MYHKCSSEELRAAIVSKLSHHFGLNPYEASDEHFYKAISLVVKDIIFRKSDEFENQFKETGNKKVYYLCMEFLIGRSLKNNLFNLGLEQNMIDALKEFDVKLQDIYEQEPDAGLGNGGLGRLAACYLDALATLNYPVMGYSLRYEYGIFSQKLIDGWQTELPDFWLNKGDVWLQALPEKSLEILLDGEVVERWEDGYHTTEIINANKVTAIPYDFMITGFNGEAVSKLRLWAAKAEKFDMNLFNSGEYIRAVEQSATAELITKVLYPEDNHPEGKSLRLSQQYFLVSASIQDIVRRHLHKYNSLDDLPSKVAIHLNDTHPVLAVPELMRIMLDECGYTWDDAWNIVTQTVAYTNHTVMHEALECWSEDLFKRRLPRIHQIVEEINKRFCDQMYARGFDSYQVGKMAILDDGIIRMANLAAIASYSINGVSKLHTELLKNSVFKDFYNIMPEKFCNVTNGIAYRRWLNQSNPALANFIKELIGDNFTRDANELEKLLAFKDDKTVLDQLAKIKYENKLRICKHIKDRSDLIIDPNSIFDVQVKRLHEYKRQHMNALHILSTYQWLRENPNAAFTPKTYIFGAKAAAGYYFAKEIIRFIVLLGDKINSDPLVNQKLKVVYMEDYKVTLAEKLIPAAEISEQISLAGTEASGTSNMKFMINGAITIGTLDGANVEMTEVLGEDNIILFGMKAQDVEAVKKAGYKPSIHYNNNMIIRRAIDEMRDSCCGVKFDDIVSSLILDDPYMVLADFSDYSQAQQKASAIYNDKTRWNQMSLVNIAKSGIFSADRAVKEYAENIWRL